VTWPVTPAGRAREYREEVSYEDVFSDVVKVIEGVGAGIMVVGGLFALGRYAQRVIAHAPEPYRELRENLGRAILLGLEVLIIADIIRTIVVDQSLESVAILGLIVAIRIVLSFSLDVEIEGTWPWNRWRSEPPGRATAQRADAGE
jgi:uncharacterized membrane protein